MSINNIIIARVKRTYFDTVRRGRHTRRQGHALATHFRDVAKISIFPCLQPRNFEYRSQNAITLVKSAVHKHGAVRRRTTPEQKFCRRQYKLTFSRDCYAMLISMTSVRLKVYRRRIRKPDARILQRRRDWLITLHGYFDYDGCNISRIQHCCTLRCRMFEIFCCAVAVESPNASRVFTDGEADRDGGIYGFSLIHGLKCRLAADSDWSWVRYF